jgi:hypothetical protein
MILATAAAVASAQAIAQAPANGGAQPPAQGTLPQPPAQAALSGSLVFVDDRPAIKTDSATVLLSMPRFFEYAYRDGFKAGAAIKAQGFLAQPQSDDKAALGTLLVQELTIGNKTYIIVGGPGDGKGAPRDGAAGPDQGSQPDPQGAGAGGAPRAGKK